jgi:hypothetical protein
LGVAPHPIAASEAFQGIPRKRKAAKKHLRMRSKLTKARAMASPPLQRDPFSLYVPTEEEKRHELKFKATDTILMLQDITGDEQKRYRELIFQILLESLSVKKLRSKPVLSLLNTLVDEILVHEPLPPTWERKASTKNGQVKKTGRLQRVEKMGPVSALLMALV